jgi:hypothetical protein
MSRETEFLGRFRDDCKRAVELCVALQKQAVEISPREMSYLELRVICKRLEGICRQMAHERGDDFTWLELSNYHVKVSNQIHKLRRLERWLDFGKMADVFRLSLRRIQELAERASGLTSMSASPLLLLPPYLRDKPPQRSGLIV